MSNSIGFIDLGAFGKAAVLRADQEKPISAHTSEFQVRRREDKHEKMVVIIDIIGCFDQ